MDHTLWDFDTNAKNTLFDLYNEFKLNQTIDAAFEVFYTTYLHHNKILWDRYQKGFITVDELKWKRMWRTLLEYKCGDENLAKTLSVRFLEILPTKQSLFPYTKEILTYLQDKQYQLHLITNGFETTQWNKLRNSDIEKYFSQVITSERSNSVKPEKEIFEFALQQAGASIQESVMIGDNLDADIQGAINIGMDSVFVNHISASAHVQPTFTITHLQELEEIF